MGKVRFVTPSGMEHSVDAREGETLMQLAVQAGVPGIEGECGGEMSCATCHVWIDDDWAGELRQPVEDETDLLEADDHFTEVSRLGCQIKFKDKLDGLVARIPG